MTAKTVWKCCEIDRIF